MGGRRAGALLAALLGLAAPAAADPRLDYMLHCRGCHGPDGGGAPGAAPTFRERLGRFLALPEGRAYLVRVPGTAQSELDDARTAALLNWMLAEFSPAAVPADFTPYEAAEVARLRAKALLDPAAERRRLLHALAGR
jgi:mono/diheme cytochrome c family protein